MIPFYSVIHTHTPSLIFRCDTKKALGSASDDISIKVTEEIPVERCELAPEEVCKWTTKILPKLVSTEECVDVPREFCTTVNKQTTVKVPQTQETCTKQGE